MHEAEAPSPVRPRAVCHTTIERGTIERGECLHEWAARRQPDCHSSMQIDLHLTQRINKLRTFNLVHK